MNAIVDWFRVQRHRAYLYNVAAAVGVLAAGYGWVNSSQEVLLLGLVATILGTGTARANTTTKED